MRVKFTLILVLQSLFIFGQNSVDQKVDSVLQKMTLTEKIGQLNQLDGRGTIDALKVLIKEGKIGSVMNVTDPEVTNELQRIACDESRAKIPLIFTRDVVHGFRTMFPIPLGQAATFNVDLVEQAARVAAIEATEHGIRWGFAPMLDISRDPRWGRIAESFGEDTYLTSLMGAAVIRGYQNDRLDHKQSMAAGAKHFAGYGAAEGGRDYNSTYIPERQMRNVYLPPFKEAVEAGCASIMTSFNSNDGIPATGDKFLLQDILRKEWQFEGVIFSDWGSIAEMVRTGFVEDRKSAAKQAISMGVDVDMSSRVYIQNLEELVEKGEITESLIDDAVRRLLKLKFSLGLFSDPYTDIHKAKATYSQSHLNTAEKIAEQSIVLLKNMDYILPLSKNIKNILVVGPLSDAPHDQLGTWTMDGEMEKTLTPIKAIKQKYGDKINIRFIKALEYSRDKNTSSFGEVLDAAKKSDVILAFVGEEAILSGEAHCLANLDLQGEQSKLIELLSKEETPLVTIVMAGRPLTISKQLEESDAFLYAWHPGTMGGSAICNILFGEATPSGKLPVTLPKVVGQIPIYYNYIRTGRETKGNEATLDEIPINARQSVLGHSSYYLDVGSKPLFPFGYGLSYTSFKVSNLNLSNEELKKEDVLKVSIDIENIGKYTGTEVLQLYVTDEQGSIVRPVKELKDFKRVTLLAGERQTIVFELPITKLAFTNKNLEYIVEPGVFTVAVGQNSDTDIKKKFTVK